MNRIEISSQDGPGLTFFIEGQDPDKFIWNAAHRTEPVYTRWAAWYPVTAQDVEAYYLDFHAGYLEKLRSNQL